VTEPAVDDLARAKQTVTIGLDIPRANWIPSVRHFVAALRVYDSKSRRQLSSGPLGRNHYYERSSMKNILISIAFPFILMGCMTGGTFTYTPSDQSPLITTSIDVDKSKDATWSQLVSGLSSNYFVINTMDNKSGFINLNYTSDPEQYIDGGEFHSKISVIQFTGPNKDSIFQFPASRASVVYKTAIDGAPYEIHRQLGLKGKINLVVSELSANRSRLTVNINYILDIKETGYNDYHETISFMSGQSAKSSIDSAEFRSNGKFEQSILNLVK
jgi:hypothetical protein